VLSFDIACFQNEFLAWGASDVNAIITVSASGGETVQSDPLPASSAVVMLVDVSGSMKGEKIHQARIATMEAINCLDDGARFAVVAGSNLPDRIYPRSGLAVASPQTRDEARTEVKGLRAEGGTRIGTWLRAATELLVSERGVRQAILLTDGKNENETPEDLDQALVEAAPVFQCDCRGVGTDWSVAELRGISQALKGTCGIVAEPAGLTTDFKQMMRQVMEKTVADVRLRVWVPHSAEIVFFKQVSPELVPMDPVESGTAQSVDYLLGSWAEESRDYHLAVHVSPGEIGDEMLAARATVVVEGTPAGQTPVRAIWTDDNALSTRVNRQVAHYSSQEELAEAIEDGIRAKERGDAATAMVRLGRAVQLATAAGDAEKIELLGQVVDVDPDTGRVRLKKDVAKADVMSLDTRSTRTAPVRPSGYDGDSG
jgi:von Willebrand factor type A domain/von Willebrand factor type A C-terminal domain